jgi:hypothetical protein
MPIIDFTPVTTPSPYAGLVATELAALVEAGDGKATEFTVPTIDANKVSVLFAKEDNKINKTARFQVRESDGKTKKDKDADGNPIDVPIGNTRFVITLAKKHASRHVSRQNKADDGNTEPAAAE